MPTLRDRMAKAGPLWKAMASRFDAMVDAINELKAINVVGQSAHKVNDAANVVTTSDAADLDGAINVAQEAIDDYEVHIGSSTYHLAADSTNVVTEIGVPKEVYALLNELKVDYEANRVNTTSHHGAADSTNALSAADATSKATAVTLAMDLKTNYEAHRVLLTSSVHGAADATNVITEADVDSSSTWEEIAALADDIRTQYEAHRVLTAGSVHAGADSTNTVTAGAVGTFATAVYAGLNELKTDLNAHIGEFGTSHAIKDDSMLVSAANASDTETAITLANALKAAYNDHITTADEFTDIPSLDLTE